MAISTWSMQDRVVAFCFGINLAQVPTWVTDDTDWIRWCMLSHGYYSDLVQLAIAGSSLTLLHSWRTCGLPRPIFLCYERHYQNSQNIVSQKFEATQ